MRLMTIAGAWPGRGYPRRGVRLRGNILDASGRLTIGSELEESDPFAHFPSLLLKCFSRRSVLLDQGRILLRDLIHLCDRLVDFVDRCRLFAAGGAIWATISVTLLMAP